MSHAIKILLSAWLCCQLSVAQQAPLGQWNVHVPYQSAVGLAIAGNSVWGGLEASLLRVDMDDQSMTKLTKASGLSDVEVASVAYDVMTETVIIAYTNTNIDLIKGNSVTNIPDIRNAFITGDKSINGIFTRNGTAWLSCGFGIVKLNLTDNEVSDTYFVGPGNTPLQINDIWADDNYIFAATQDGVLRGTISPFVNLSNADDPQAWLRYTFEDHQLPEQPSEVIDALAGKVYVFQGDEFFSMDMASNQWTSLPMETDWVTTASLSNGANLYIAQQFEPGGEVQDARIGTFNGTGFDFQNDNGQVVRPRDLAIDGNGRIWYADFFAGLTLIDNGSHSRFIANGPYKRTVLDMEYYNGAIYAASTNMSTTLDGDNIYLPYGFYVSNQQVWTNYNEFNTPGLVGMEDIASIEAIGAENKLLIAAHDNGLIEYDLSSGATQVFERPSDEDEKYRCIAMESDASGNIWIANAYASKTPLVCRTPGGGFINFTAKTAALLGLPINSVVVDEFNQIWLGTTSRGAYVYNYNGTLEDQSDDILKQVGTALNIPSTDVRCLASDQDGEIWIGTTGGIGVVFCPGSVINNTCQVDRICIPRRDTTNFCDNLLENELVNCITIDPANRKWIGTNRGVFLQSADGLETVHYFNEENSPLLSDVIRSIAVDANTGDVYIGTAKGINTFRADATFTDEQADLPPLVYPNPVRPEYRGPIAIRNLPNNANVKIVDVAGHLVFETESVGGQAVWDGLDVDGNRPKSGVYIVLSANDDGSYKKTAKFVFIH